ncbi:MAG: hypothetical protein ABI806_05535 [Candidatus Solibacter sp.]
MTNRVFTSWVRRGAAAAIIEPDPASGGWRGPATFQPSVKVKKDGGPPIEITGPPSLPLLGAGAVSGLIPKAVLRTDPRDGATGVEDNYLVQVEFSRPDLPWIFTPAKPNSKNRLRPWLVLIVVDAAIVQLQPGSPLPRISVRNAALPDLDDSWGWAHAQATVESDANAPAKVIADKAALALGPASGTSAVSRLLCPMRLLANKTYMACIVPATLPGVKAGLGEEQPGPGVEIAQAWTVGGPDVVLPVYYSWRFSTGADGDFRSLVQRLRGVRATEISGFGARTVDISSPWQQGEQLPPGSTVDLGGALATGAEHPLSDEAQEAFEPRLTKLLNSPADQQPEDVVGDPALSAVAPPIYAGRHAGAKRVPPTGWLRTLNVDPRRRIAAAFGTQYVQENQEFLMAEAWNQLGAVQDANRLQALAELAAEVGDRMHQRHIAGLDFSRLISVAVPARTRVLIAQPAGPALTLHATVAATLIPAGAATVAFSRFTRFQGPIGKRTFQKAPAILETALRGNLKIGPVLQDGIATLQPLTAPAVTDPTAGMVARALQTVATMEKAVPIPTTASLQILLKATNTKVGFVQGKPAVKFAMPGVRPQLALAAKPANPDAMVLGLTLTLAASLLPSRGIFRRFQGRVQIPDRLGAGKATRVMACPQFTAPLAMAVKDAHRDWLVPGLGNFPDDRVTVLRSEGAFVESFLAGANHEMNREFLWRGYPTDQRGTPFRFFWPRPDRTPDIPPMTSWPLATALGKNGTKGGKDVENMAVLLVRGELIHRYPRSIVYLAKGIRNDQKITLDLNESAWLAPDFSLRLDDRTTAFAYNVGVDEIRTNAANPAGRFFVFSEPVTGPRFNFELATTLDQLNLWTDLDWPRVPQQRGFAFAGGSIPLPKPAFNAQGASWNKDAADIARIAFARPFRVAYHADELLPVAGV